MTILALVLAMAGSKGLAPIDRHALVSRHDVVLTAFDGDRPLQVGNGEFAFGMDITGLQTFAPFNTMSHWGWHSSPPPEGQSRKDYVKQVVDTHGRPIRYPMPDPQHPALSAWMAGNPHAINLGRVGFEITKKDGSPAEVADLTGVRQRLDLWTGVVTSQFEVEGEPVTVRTACHSSVDALAVQVESSLVGEGRLSVFFDSPGDDTHQFANFVGDWNRGGGYRVISAGASRAELESRLGSDVTSVSLAWAGQATLVGPDTTSHPELKIVSALYGAGSRVLDVTEKVQAAVKDGRLWLRVGNNLGPDPALGVGKSLKLVYESAGKRETLEEPENGEVSIDVAPGRRRVRLKPAAGADKLGFVCAYAPSKAVRAPAVEATFEASKKGWESYWRRGGVIDLSESTDPRWMELERRIVLSQYLMKVNEAGSEPPQESGLVNNGWFGRWHMEMYWWHAAHWALWNRQQELEKSLGIYKRLLKGAKELAKSEGYLGARWPKCIGPDGLEWPHEIHSFLIWQQPHPIFFAEMDYRAHPTRETLEKWQPIVEATADFLASYAFFDPTKKEYVLGPPLMVVSENTDGFTTQNPAFELGYWRFGLRTAALWRERMGLTPRDAWGKVLKGLSPIPEQEGLYVLHEGVKDMWTKWTFEHPALTGIYGMLPGDGVDVAAMRRTLDKVHDTWDFNHTWGWDFPMLAMCAARLGEGDRAIEFLLHSSGGFQFDERGLATGGPFPYFPSNGALLYAVALMAAGWDGAPARNAPGFPADGKWKVRWEGLSPAL